MTLKIRIRLARENRSPLVAISLQTEQPSFPLVESQQRYIRAYTMVQYDMGRKGCNAVNWISRAKGTVSMGRGSDGCEL